MTFSTTCVSPLSIVTRSCGTMVYVLTLCAFSLARSAFSSAVFACDSSTCVTGTSRYE